MNWASVVHKCIQSCVLVQITGRDSLHKKNTGIPSSKSENGITTLSASGVIVDAKEGLIVTSGSIITPFLVQDDITKFPKDNHTLLSGTHLSILLYEPGGSIENSWLDATVVGVWACEGMGRCIRQLGKEFQYRLETGWRDLGDMQEGGREGGGGGGGEPSMSMVEFVAVVKLTNPNRVISSVAFGNSNKLALGQPIAVVGSPFGCISPIAFFNSVSSGVISHTFHGGDHGSADLVMIDARSLPGTEGGGVFDADGNLVGIVAPRIRYTEGFPMDLNFIIPSNLLADLLSHIGNFTPRNFTADTFLPSNVRLARKSVVCLQIGNSWASGILVSKYGHILTNAHLFKSIIAEIMRNKPIPEQEYSHLKVKVFFNKSTTEYTTSHPPSNLSQHPTDTTKQCVVARVEYISHNHLDIALLQVEKEGIEVVNQVLRPMKASHSVETTIGMPVWVVAHGFAPERGMEPVCSQGLLANVILREGVPASLQTSASVNSGNSGGLLVNSNGELVGMVMSHATHRGNRTFTQLNFSIPYQQFITLINYANGEDKLAIQRLQSQPTDNFLASLWKFLPEQKETPKVAQKFMKFMEHMKTNEVGPPGAIKPMSIPRSKL